MLCDSGKNVKIRDTFCCSFIKSARTANTGTCVSNNRYKIVAAISSACVSHTEDIGGRKTAYRPSAKKRPISAVGQASEICSCSGWTGKRRTSISLYRPKPQSADGALRPKCRCDRRYRRQLRTCRLRLSVMSCELLSLIVISRRQH